MQRKNVILGCLALAAAVWAVLRTAGPERGRLLVLGMFISMGIIMAFRRRRPLRLSSDDPWIKGRHEEGLPVRTNVSCTLTLREKDLAILADERTFTFPYEEIADIRMETDQRREVGSHTAQSNGKLVIHWLSEGEETPIVLRMEDQDAADLMAIRCRFRIMEMREKER